MIQPVNPKGNHPWIFIRRIDAEDEAPIFWSPDEKNWLIGKEPDAGKNWRQEEKWMTEDEIVGWHHWLNEHEFEQTQGYGEGQGSLMCHSSWDCKDLNMTKWLYNNYGSSTLGSNLCLLHWHAGSLPWSHQGNLNIQKKSYKILKLIYYMNSLI